MWRSINVVAHAINTKELEIQNSCTNFEIMAELSMERGALPKRMHHLFRGKHSHLLDKNLNKNIKWLITIYASRDQFRYRFIHKRTRQAHIGSL